MLFEVDENIVTEVNENTVIALNKTRFTNQFNTNSIVFSTLHENTVYSFIADKGFQDKISYEFYYNNRKNVSAEDIINNDSDGWMVLPFISPKLAEIMYEMDLNDHQCMKDLHKMIVNMFNHIFAALDNPGLVLAKSSR